MITTFLLVKRQIQRHTNSYWVPNTDVYFCRNDLVIRLEAGGMRLQDFSISFNDSDSIIIRGSRTDLVLKDQYIQMEVPYGEFQIIIDFPAGFIPEAKRTKASYENGFLNIRCPQRQHKRILLYKGQKGGGE
jgi:HSP20 family molecular chaperone IbpA